MFVVILYSSVQGNKTLQLSGERSRKNNLVMVVDDFNASLDKKDVKFYYRNLRNNNGKLMKDLMKINGLLLTKYVFSERKRQTLDIYSSNERVENTIWLCHSQQKWAKSTLRLRSLENIFV